MNELLQPDTARIVIGEQERSKQDVLEEGRRLATSLLRLGLKEGDALALLLRNSFPFVSASIAAQFVGAYPVPLNWHYRREEVRYVLENCGARLLVGNEDLIVALGDAIPKGTVCISVPDGHQPTGPMPLGTLRWDQCCAANRYKGEFKPLRASMIYTSGTTGRPKGVKRELATPQQEAEFSKLSQEAYGIRSGMRSLVTGPLYHALPNMAMRHGIRLAETLVILPKFDPEQVLHTIERYRITHAVMVPTMFVRLLGLPDETRCRYDLGSLEYITHTAAPCPPDIKQRMIDWLGPVINEVYGGTELGCVAHCDSAEWLEHKGTVGKLARGTRLEVTDDQGKPLKDGEIGEIYARNQCFADFTYHGDPQKRSAVERNGLISIGDIGYLRDGFLYICDRKADMVIIGGVNIYPAEVEAMLLSSPDIVDCAVFGIPDDDLGEVLCAAVELQPGAVMSAADIQAYLANVTAAYKIPRRFEFHQRLPRQENGKVLKRLLKEPYWAAAGRRI